MKWILYVMLFNTPAVNITSKAEIACLAKEDVSDIGAISLCRPDFEGKHVWSLQTASQLEFSTLESCVKHQDRLIANSNVASTMTLRSWCFCDSDKEECPSDKQADDAAAAIRGCEVKPDSTACQESKKKTHAFFGLPAGEKGQNSSSVRLYPPPKKK